MSLRTRACACACVGVCVWVCVCMYVHVCMCVYICVCMLCVLNWVTDWVTGLHEQQRGCPRLSPATFQPLTRDHSEQRLAVGWVPPVSETVAGWLASYTATATVYIENEERCHDMTWHDMTWHNITWHGITWHDTIWLDTVQDEGRYSNWH